jgi:hypothetical protein
MALPASERQCRQARLQRNVISQVTFTGARSPDRASSEPNEYSFVFQLVQGSVQRLDFDIRWLCVWAVTGQPLIEGTAPPKKLASQQIGRGQEVELWAGLSIEQQTEIFLTNLGSG